MKNYICSNKNCKKQFYSLMDYDTEKVYCSATCYFDLKECNDKKYFKRPGGRE